MNDRSMTRPRDVARAEPQGRTNVAQEARLEEIRAALLGKADDLTLALAGTIPAAQFIEIALTMIASIKHVGNKSAAEQPRAKVLACSTESLVRTVIRAAQIGVRVDGKQATVIPYGSEAELTVMVKGRLDLMNRVPGVAGVKTGHVLEGDDFDQWTDETGDHIRHVPQLDPKPDAKMIAAYAIIRFKDGRSPVITVLPRSRIEVIRTTMSKQPTGDAWRNSPHQMGEKCALNRAEHFIETDPEWSRRLELARSTEFEVDRGDDPEQVVARVGAQLDQARQQIQQIKGQTEAEERASLLGAIVAEVARQDMSTEQAEQEATAALVGWEEPRKANGVPDAEKISLAALREILDHMRALGPGFDGDGPPDGSEDPRDGGAGGTSGVAPGLSTSGAQGSGGVQTGGGPKAAPRPPEPDPKLDPLGCRKIKPGKVHLIDPRSAARPPKCIGCGSLVGAAQGAAGFQATNDPEVYCPDALVEASKFDADRVPDQVLAAIERTAWGAEAR